MCPAEQRLCDVQLGDLYENDCIFDKFDCCFSGDGSHVATGTYSNCFRVISRGDPGAAAPASDIALEASRDPQRKRFQQTPSKACYTLEFTHRLLFLLHAPAKLCARPGADATAACPERLLEACSTHAPGLLVLFRHHMMAHYGMPCTCEGGVTC